MLNQVAQFAQKTLYECEIGKPYLIARCNLDEEVKNRLYEMGLVPQTVVSVTKRAPLGDPLQIALRGYYLCIRGSIAKSFEMKEIQP